MVKYYGRARHTNWFSKYKSARFKDGWMSLKRGKKRGNLDRYVGNRVNCNLKVCGYRRGAAPGARQYRCIHGVNYTLNTAGNWAIANKCVLVDPTIAKTICENPAPRTRQQAGGVGSQNSAESPPRLRKCSKKAFRRTWLLETRSQPSL